MFSVVRNSCDFVQNVVAWFSIYAIDSCNFERDIGSEILSRRRRIEKNGTPTEERSIAFSPPLFDPIDSTLIWNTLLISSVTTASRYRMSRRSTAEESLRACDRSTFSTIFIYYIIYYALIIIPTEGELLMKKIRRYSLGQSTMKDLNR